MMPAPDTGAYAWLLLCLLVPGILFVGLVFSLVWWRLDRRTKRR